jgi:hypothetical protein
MGEESAHHISFECEARGHIRYSVFGPPGFELDNSPRTHQAPVRPDKKKAGIFYWL